MTRPGAVSRPLRKSEFVILFDSSNARRGWADALAVRRNALVDAWEKLTATPTTRSVLCYPLLKDHAIVVRNGESHQRWQLKLNERDGVRIWFYVVGQTVFIENVFTSHPNATK
jgi:hypothetical protein